MKLGARRRISGVESRQGRGRGCECLTLVLDFRSARVCVYHSKVKEVFEHVGDTATGWNCMLFYGHETGRKESTIVPLLASPKPTLKDGRAIKYDGGLKVPKNRSYSCDPKGPRWTTTVSSRGETEPWNTSHREESDSRLSGSKERITSKNVPPPSGRIAPSDRLR